MNSRAMAETGSCVVLPFNRDEVRSLDRRLAEGNRRLWLEKHMAIVGYLKSSMGWGTVTQMRSSAGRSQAIPPHLEFGSYLRHTGKRRWPTHPAVWFTLIGGSTERYGHAAASTGFERSIRSTKSEDRSVGADGVHPDVGLGREPVLTRLVRQAAAGRLPSRPTDALPARSGTRRAHRWPRASDMAH